MIVLMPNPVVVKKTIQSYASTGESSDCIKECSGIVSDRKPDQFVGKGWLVPNLIFGKKCWQHSLMMVCL